jgi:1-deoxy-D-xylulose-5-phosphate reductoisomerase
MSARQDGLAILGSTGSVGRSTLSVVAMHREKFRVAVLAANRSWQTIVEQARPTRRAAMELK